MNKPLDLSKDYNEVVDSLENYHNLLGYISYYQCQYHLIPRFDSFVYEIGKFNLGEYIEWYKSGIPKKLDDYTILEIEDFKKELLVFFDRYFSFLDSDQKFGISTMRKYKKDMYEDYSKYYEEIGLEKAYKIDINIDKEYPWCHDLLYHVITKDYEIMLAFSHHG